LSRSRDISSSIAFSLLLRDLPLTNGTLQYEQKLLHPSCILTNTRVCPENPEMPSGFSEFFMISFTPGMEEISSSSFSTRQPVTTIFAFGLIFFA